MPNTMIVANGKKFMWDGLEYTDPEKVSEKMNKYKGDGFEVELFEEDGKKYLYTRRLVKEAVVQNA